MAIPNVRVNVNEMSLAGQNVQVPFIPAVILKTKSGPVGTVERISSEAEFIRMFGQSDASVPAAYALQKYLKLYQYAYVTRVANKNSAAYGKANLAFTTKKEVLSTMVEIAGQEEQILEKTVSDIVKTDTKILSNGAVKGELTKVEGWSQYSEDSQEQTGYFLPIKLKVKGAKTSFKVNGEVVKEEDYKENTVIRIPNYTDVIDVLVDGATIISLNFAMVKFGDDREALTTEISLDLISASSLYKSDIENGKEVKLVVDSETNKIFIDLTSIMGRNMTTIKEDISTGSIKAAERDEAGNLTGGLEYILDKLVASANAITGIPVVFENKFKDKLDSDAVPTSEQFTAGFSAYIEGGDSGNDVDVEVNDIKDLIDLYNYQDFPIDEMVIPEYRQPDIVNYAVEKSIENFYRVIAQTTGHTLDEMKLSVQNYSQNNRGKLEIYAGDATYTDFVDTNGNLIECPSSIAVLEAYANANYNENQWCAVGGVNRGTLTQVTGWSVRLTKAQMDELYENIIPVNTINYISSIGYVVWGNKTSADPSKTKIFDRVNVSRLINHLERELTQVGWRYLFEPITLSLFQEFKAALEAIVQEVADENGVEDFIVVCNSSNNTDESIARNELHADVQVKPIEALEYVIINLTGTDTITLTVEETEEV